MKDGGELKFALSDPIANWNNSTVEGNTAAMSQIFAFISPSLFLYDSAGKATPRPEFFKSIKGEVKNGKTVVSIELNDKAVWGDGKKIVADDYIKTMQSATNKDYGWASTDGLVDIEKFDKESDTKFSITWKSTYPDWSCCYHRDAAGSGSHSCRLQPMALRTLPSTRTNGSPAPTRSSLTTLLSSWLP